MAIKLKLTVNQIPWFLVAKIAAVCGVFVLLSPIFASIVTIACLVIPRSHLRAYMPAIGGLVILAFLTLTAITKMLVVIAILALLIQKEYKTKTNEWLQFAYYIACGAALTLWIQIPQPFLSPANTIATTAVAVWFAAVVWVLQQEEADASGTRTAGTASLAAAIVTGALVWQLLQVVVLLPWQPHWQLAAGFWGMAACIWYLLKTPESTSQDS